MTLVRKAWILFYMIKSVGATTNLTVDKMSKLVLLLKYNEEMYADMDSKIDEPSKHSVWRI